MHKLNDNNNKYSYILVGISKYVDHAQRIPSRYVWKCCQEQLMNNRSLAMFSHYPEGRK